MLREGRLSLSTVTALKDVLTAENHRDLLGQAAGMTKEQVEALVAILRPKAVPRDSVRRAPAGTHRRAPRLRGAGARRGTAPAGPAVTTTKRAEQVLVAVQPIPPTKIEPVSEDLRVLRVTVSRAFLAELEEVKGALSHKVPSGRLEAVLRECFRVVLERHRKKTGMAAHEESGAGGPSSAAEAKETPSRPPSASESGGPCASTCRRRCSDRYGVEMAAGASSAGRTATSAGPRTSWRSTISSRSGAGAHRRWTSCAFTAASTISGGPGRRTEKRSWHSSGARTAPLLRRKSGQVRQRPMRRAPHRQRRPEAPAASQLVWCCQALRTICSAELSVAWKPKTSRARVTSG